MGLFSNQFHRLRAQRLAESTKDFLARGKSVARCEICQLASHACLCPWRPSLVSRCDFILLMHRNEVFKPTNTGRLIADVLPQQTHVFCWSRTEPAAELLQLLDDSSRQCFIVFPAETTDSIAGTNAVASALAPAVAPARKVFREIPGSDKTPTFILLDGTWKQSGRMFHLSQWLKTIPCISLAITQGRGYAVRKSHQDDYLSTAEAAALCLQMANESHNSETLLNYFQVFNEHYLATRGCYTPAQGALHRQLENLG